MILLNRYPPLAVSQPSSIRARPNPGAFLCLVHAHSVLNGFFQPLPHKLMTAEIRVNHLDIDMSEVTA